MEDNNKTKEQLVEELNKIRKQVTELEKSEQHKISPEFLPDGYLRVDSKGKITDCNSAFLFLTGYSREDIVNKHFTKLPTLRLKDMPRYIKIFNSARRGKFPKSIELKWIHKDETTRWGEAYFNIERKKHRISGFNIITRDTTKRKKAEEKIYKLTQFQQSILDNMDIWLNVLDDKGNIVLWNKAAEKISGYSKKDVIGHSKIWEWSYPEEKYRKEIFSQYNKIVTEFEVVENFETQLRCKNGENKIISWNSRNLSDKKGNPMGSIALGQDITERKQREEELRESEMRYQGLVDNLPGVVFQCSADWTITYMNDYIKKITGFSASDFIENKVRSYASIMNTDDVKNVVQALNEYIENKETYYAVEYRIEDKNGDEKWVHSFGNIFYKRNGEVDSFDGIVMDITERKRVEESLKNNILEIQFLAKMLNDSSQPFAVGSQDGKLLRFNPAFCHLTGYSEKELLNDISWNETLTPPEWQEYEVEILNTLLSTGEPQRFEKEYIHKEGRRIFVELLMHRKLDEDGNLECVYGFINDITERKQAEEEVKHSQQELQKLEGLPIVWTGNRLL